MIIIPDEKLEAALNAISTAAHTGEIGDGKIFVSPVEDAIRIRTGDRGPEAL
jgi:nitrogen regulatory protein P-II 1